MPGRGTVLLGHAGKQFKILCDEPCDGSGPETKPHFPVIGTPCEIFNFDFRISIGRQRRLQSDGTKYAEPKMLGSVDLAGLRNRNAKIQNRNFVYSARSAIIGSTRGGTASSGEVAGEEHGGAEDGEVDEEEPEAGRRHFGHRALENSREGEINGNADHHADQEKAQTLAQDQVDDVSVFAPRAPCGRRCRGSAAG